MKIPAQDLACGDLLQVHDWRLHVMAVDTDAGTVVQTAEFGFPLHYAPDELVDVVAPVHRNCDEPISNCSSVSPPAASAGSPPELAGARQVRNNQLQSAAADLVDAHGAGSRHPHHLTGGSLSLSAVGDLSSYHGTFARGLGA